MVATSPTGGAWRIALAAKASDCGGATPCPPTWTEAISPMQLEGGSLVDAATLASGVDLSLVARSGQSGDAEGATLALLAGAMGDQQRELDVPELVPGGTASPIDGWLAAAGDQVAVGFGPVTGYLLSVEGDHHRGRRGQRHRRPARGHHRRLHGAARHALDRRGCDHPGHRRRRSAPRRRRANPRRLRSGPGQGHLRLVDRATAEEVAAW